MKKSTFKKSFNEILFQFDYIPKLISIIIPVYKNAKGLEDTLQSIKKQTIKKNQFEIIVANDGGDNKISTICKRYKVREIIIVPNMGSYYARNEALTISKGEYFAFTDADVTVPNDWIENGLSLLSNYDYVGGPINFSKKIGDTSEEKFAILFEFNVKAAFKCEHFFVTANMFTKRKVIEDIGGFDNRLFSGGDTEFGNRVNKNKFKTFYSEDLFVIHPFRNFEGIVKKKKRVTKGKNILIQLYPERYSHLLTSYFDEFIQAARPPLKYIKDIHFFFFLWRIQLIEMYYKFKYIQHLNLLQPTNVINKSFNRLFSKFQQLFFFKFLV